MDILINASQLSDYSNKSHSNMNVRYGLAFNDLFCRNLMFVAMRRFITVDGMMFYNSGINFQKNINIYKELKEFSDFKLSYVKRH